MCVNGLKNLVTCGEVKVSPSIHSETLVCALVNFTQLFMVNPAGCPFTVPRDMLIIVWNGWKDVGNHETERHTSWWDSLWTAAIEPYQALALGYSQV